MLYYKNNQFNICPFIAHYKSYGKPEFKYAPDKKWWIDVANDAWHVTDLTFTAVNPTEAQQTRLEEINNAETPEGFGHEASMYVETGWVVNPDNPHFQGFVESPEALEKAKTGKQKRLTDYAKSFLTDKMQDYSEWEAITWPILQEEAKQFLVDGTVGEYMQAEIGGKYPTASDLAQIILYRADLMKQLRAAVVLVRQQHEAGINACLTVQEVEDYDISTGWPVA